MSQVWSFAFLHLNSMRFVGSLLELLKVPLNKSPMIRYNLGALVQRHLQTC